jgi:hypothetical protein
VEGTISVAESTDNNADKIRKFATDPHLDTHVPHNLIFLPSLDFLSTLCHSINDINFKTEYKCQEVG